MAVLEGGVSGALAGVGAEAGNPLHVVARPLSHGVLGHYRVTHTCTLVNAQAANSRLFEVRNAGTNLIIPTRLRIGWSSNQAHTALLNQFIECFRLTGFSVNSTTNTVTPVPSVKRTAGMAASPGGAAIRGVTIAGAAAGMTGFTSTKDTGAFFTMSMIEAVAVMAATETISRYQDEREVFNHGPYGHPFVFANNEGFLIEERVVEAAAGGSFVTIDLEYAEVTAF